MNELERAAKFRETMHRLEDEAQDAACPIYGIRGLVGGPVGSGFLLRVADETVLITAAHVFYRRHQLPLYIPGPGEPIPIEGEAYFTGPRDPHENPDFELDIALIVLNVDTAAKVSGVEILTLGDLDLNDRPAAQTLYGFTGFPGDENMPLPDYKLLRKSYYYGGQPAEEGDCQFLGVILETHFVMKFEQGQMVDRSGAIVAVPEPGGMSGGPVWKLGAFQEVDNGDARKKVIGITIEWWRNRNVLVGVRIGVAVEALRQTLPRLASHLPETRYLKVNVDLKMPQPT